MGPRPHLPFCAFKRAPLGSEFYISIGPSTPLWFLHANRRLLDQNYKSLWVPVLTCRFVHAKQRDLPQTDTSIWVPARICGFCMKNSVFWSRITSLYGSQTSPVVLGLENSVISIRITGLYGSQASCVVFGCKTATFGPEKQVSMVP